MLMRRIPQNRDRSFYQYKLLQLALLLIVSLLVYAIHVIFDVDGTVQKDEVQEKEMKIEDLKWKNIYKKYIEPNKPVDSPKK